jgi:hypothetical protein
MQTWKHHKQEGNLEFAKSLEELEKQIPIRALKNDP